MRGEHSNRAWTVSHLMMAAGVKPEAVTIDKLLGRTPKPRKAVEAEPDLPLEEIFRRLKEAGAAEAEAKALPKPKQGRPKRSRHGG